MHPPTVLLCLVGALGSLGFAQESASSDVAASAGTSEETPATGETRKAHRRTRKPKENRADSTAISATGASLDAAGIPIDFAAKYNLSGPWSTPPYCIAQASVASTDQADIDAKTPINPNPEPICLFNDKKFQGGRGISLITTPTVAQNLIVSPSWTEAPPAGAVNVNDNPPFFVTELPGRGKGVISNKTLHRGDLIQRYTPVHVLIRSSYDTISEEDRKAFQRNAIDRLPPYANKVFNDLMGHFGGDKVDDIVTTNSFRVYLGDAEVTHTVVLPETSRFNHDCRPNAHYWFDNNTMTHHVHAVRTIHIGEEITISYIDAAKPREERQSHIKNSWGFDCSCSLCTAPKIFTDASDDRIAKIIQLETLLDDYTASSKATPEMAVSLISLYEQERLIAPSAAAYVFAALTHNGEGEADAAVGFAYKAYEMSLLLNGPQAFDTQTMLELLEDPEEHWSWMQRVDARKDAADKKTVAVKREREEKAKADAFVAAAAEKKASSAVDDLPYKRSDEEL